MRLLPLALLCLVGLAACRGPKGSPDGSVKSFFAAAEAKDYEALAATITTQALGKLGSKEQAMSYFEGQFQSWTDVEVTINETFIDVGGTTATVHFTCVGESIANYKMIKFDCSDIVSLTKEDDGKWHIVPPGPKKLRPL